MNRIKIIMLIIIAFTLIQCNEPIENKASEAPILQVEKQDVELGEQQKPFYQGVIKETLDAGGYTYLLIQENLEGHVHEEGHEHKPFWIAVNRTPAKVGDEVRFQKELVTEQFYSKILDRTFDELMFASNLQYKVEE